MLALIAALKQELSGLLADMQTDEKLHIKGAIIYKGKLHNKQVLLIQSGVGKERIRNALKAVFSFFKPSLIINIGFAGALNPVLEEGEVVIAKLVIDMQNGRHYSVEEEIIMQLESAAEKSKTKYRQGNIITTDKPIHSPHEKAFAGTKYNAIACDMESVVVAKLCTDENIPFGIARSIFDRLDVNLDSLEQTVDCNGNIAAWSITSRIIKQPQLLLRLPKYRYLCNTARNSLSTLATSIIKGG